MLRYLRRRLFQSIFVVLGVTFVSFGVLFLTGDPAAVLLGDVELTQSEMAEFRHQMGFDRPWYVQYGDYIWRVAHFDFGKSYYHGISNATLILDTIPATIELAIVSTAMTLVIGIPIGMFCAFRRNSLTDRATMAGALLAQAMPTFWLGLMLMLVFAEILRWLPVSGRGGIEHIILPAITLSLMSIARNARMVRSSMLEVLGQDYIRTARAKGLSERIVQYKHALKNAMIPVMTIIGMDIGYRLGGSVIVETVFGYPGVGRMVIQSINNKDVPLLQACVIVLALLFVGVNLLVDFLYVYVDPRIRHS
ncbi:MAG: ABC transporter permease [Desulfobacteraceae bacterium]|nr:ABC transporter permease [Desulfobacteraceae bacterium]